VFTGNHSAILVGQTENISRNGALVSWSGEVERAALPVPGDLLIIDIELPAQPSFGRRCMHCEAVVTRVVDANGHPSRVALHIKQMSFRRDNTRAATRPLACPVM
jgi:hypothetical protein